MTDEDRYESRVNANASGLYSIGRLIKKKRYALHVCGLLHTISLVDINSTDIDITFFVVEFLLNDLLCDY